MNAYSYFHEGAVWHRVSKQAARKAYDAGQTVGVCPCKMRPDSWWGGACYIDNNERGSFDTWLNTYEFYNCNYNELGLYPAFYLEG